MKRPALGKGLGALIPEAGAEREHRGIIFSGVEDIFPNPDQPRNRFDQEGLESLAETIRKRGILQPLLVRRKGEKYELIAGERRLRAAKIAGLEKVPIIVNEVDTSDSLEISLLENIQREDLNPVEEARAYKVLLDRVGLTQEELAKKLGKDRSSLTNSLRLLNLPKAVQKDIENGLLTPGHGRALLALPEGDMQLKASHVIKSRKLSVRETEAYIKRLQPESTQKDKKPQRIEDQEFMSVQDELCKYYGTQVKILRRGKGGRIQIDFYSWEDLDRLYSLLTRQ